MAKTWILCVKYSLMSHIIIFNAHNRVYIFIHSAGFCEVWRVRVKETRRHINVLDGEQARVQCIFNMVYLHCFSFNRWRREKVLYSPNANRAPPRCQCHEKSCHTLIWAQILASHKRLLSRRYRNFPESIVFRIWHGRLTFRRGRTYSWNPKCNVCYETKCSSIIGCYFVWWVCHTSVSQMRSMPVRMISTIWFSHRNFTSDEIFWCCRHRDN